MEYDPKFVHNCTSPLLPLPRSSRVAEIFLRQNHAIYIYIFIRGSWTNDETKSGMNNASISLSLSLAISRNKNHRVEGEGRSRSTYPGTPKINNFRVSPRSGEIRAINQTDVFDKAPLLPTSSPFLVHKP